MGVWSHAITDTDGPRLLTVLGIGMFLYGGPSHHEASETS